MEGKGALFCLLPMATNEMKKTKRVLYTTGWGRAHLNCIIRKDLPEKMAYELEETAM